ncbi:MAG: hypothetical protein PHQ35_07655 [Phycisphaerae bacterium]|nr:hypothetical protein [Phycisphaerae bacterium]MDD5380037.1 hypothetical protein [Phycisphaerae bacterium]
MIKKCYWKILLAVLSMAYNVQAKPKVVDWTILSDTPLNVAGLFIDKDNKTFVKAAGHSLWINNNQVKIDQYGYFINGFVKYGTVHLVFRPDEQNINICSIVKDIALEEHIVIEDFPAGTVVLGEEQVVYVPGESDAYYLLGYRKQTSSNPVEAMKFWISGGHGILYDKPLLAEIRGQKLLSYEMLRYGGKTNESYRIKEVLTGKDKIRFFGFRTQKQIGSGNYPYNIPDVLYYTECNTKKKKVVRTQDIYEKSPYFNEEGKLRQSAYWHVSADNFNDDLFLVFSWHDYHSAKRTDIIEMKMENINTPIYYSQNNGKGFGNAEIIGKGILPLARADSVGNIHVIWVDSNGNVVHKVKKDDKWSNEQFILNGVDAEDVWEGMCQGEWFLQNMYAEFDSDDNLNLVFTSNRKLVLAKVKLD